MLDPIRDLVTDDGFQAGLAFGLVASAVVALGGVVTRRPVPLAGAALGVAVMLGLDERFGVETDLVVGLGVLAVAGYLTGGWHPVVRIAAVVPGAVVVERSIEVDAPGWATAGFLVLTVVGGVLAADFDRAWRPFGLGPVLLGIAVLGVYGTTPETDHAVILVGAALAVALLGWPVPLGSLGAGGAPVAAALVGWTAVVDGDVRPGAVVGALACLGVMVIEPALRWIGVADLTARDRHEHGALPRVAVVVGLHLAVVAVCSRVAGLQTGSRPALAISVAAYVVGAGVLVAAASFERQAAAARLQDDTPR